MEDIYNEFSKNLYRSDTLNVPEDSLSLKNVSSLASSSEIVNPDDIDSGAFKGDQRVDSGYIESGNFKEGSAGWRIDANGDAEFNSITIRGILKFGGNGADGALALTSGATNIDLSGSKYFIKNYTSISITGTGYLTFSNPHASGTIITLKSEGDVTITSTATTAIDVSGLGGGNPATSSIISATGGGTTAYVTYGTAGANGVSFPNITGKALSVSCGGSGGGGGSSFFGGTPGSGGRGGGALIIECKGAYNFGASSTIKANGANGTNGTSNTGGGGGGGGGMIFILYKTLTANSGTYQANAGNGGTGQAAAGGGGTGILNGGTTATGGLGGKSSHPDYGGGGCGGGGNGGNTGANGSDSGGGSGGGAGGGGGSWICVENTEFS